MTKVAYCEFKIATTLVGLTPLTQLNVPPPDHWAYADFSARVPTGDGGARGDGFPRATWTWAAISRRSLYRLLALCGSNASASVYIRTPINRAAGAPFRNFLCKMIAPALEGSDGSNLDARVPGYGTVTILFQHLESA